MPHFSKNACLTRSTQCSTIEVSLVKIEDWLAHFQVSQSKISNPKRCSMPDPIGQRFGNYRIPKLAQGVSPEIYLGEYPDNNPSCYQDIPCYRCDSMALYLIDVRAARELVSSPMWVRHND